MMIASVENDLLQKIYNFNDIQQMMQRRGIQELEPFFIFHINNLFDIQKKKDIPIFLKGNTKHYFFFHIVDQQSQQYKMSEYDSQQGSEHNQGNGEQYFKVFQHDFYLSGSLPNIQQWKANIVASFQQDSQKGSNKVINVFKYLENEKGIFDREQNFLMAAYHIRYYSFANYLKLAFQDIVKQYHAAFTHNCQQKLFDIVEELQRIDSVTTQLTIYLQKLELSRAQSYVSEIDSELITSIYTLLEQAFPMVTNKYCIWRIVMFLEIMNLQTTSYIMNTPFNMSLQYYLKTFKTLKSKHSILTKIALDINVELEKQSYLQAYLQAVKEIILFNMKPKQQNEKLQLSLMCEYITCLKYMHFATAQNNLQLTHQHDLFNEYINASLKVPYYRKNDNMPTQYYEKLFLKILTQVKNQPKLTDLALYIDPNVAGERSKESFGKLEQIVLNLCKELTEAQQQFLTMQRQPQPEYLKKLLKDEQFTLLIQFLQTIMQFNKSAFLKAENQIYQTFLDMAQYLKSVFLSFGKDLWLFPQNIFTPLTLGFFKKIAQDINDDLKNILYQMVQKLNSDKLPQKLVCENGEFKLKQVTRLQYLSAIMYYIQDCSREQEYLSLPQIAPANLQTSILLIKSLHVKLKHHEPNPAQLPLFIQYLKQCQKYKLNIHFRWFKHQNYLSKSFEREIEFQIETGLPVKDIQKQFRKCLNYRDKQFARKLIQEDYNQNHLMTAVDVAALLKHNHGMEGLPEILNINEGEMFALLQEMQTMLAILPDDLFDLPLYEEVVVNYLHLLLTFYCSKIKSAEGSQIYLMILQKILINYLKSPFSRSQQFKKKYPKFFQRFIYQFHQIAICTTLNELLMQFHDKNEGIEKDEGKWTEQQRNAVNDLKQKIDIIREQFLDRLQGSQQDIAEWIVTFTSLIGEQMPFVIFLQCLKLFVKLINKKPSLGEIASVNMFLSQQTYQQEGFFKNMLNYIEDYNCESTQDKKLVKIYIMRHLLKSPEILSVIQFKELMELINQTQKFFGASDISWTNDFAELFKSMNLIALNNVNDIRPQWILPCILLFYEIQTPPSGDMDMFNEQPQKNKAYQSYKYRQMIKCLSGLEQTNKQFWPQVKMNLKEFKFNDFQIIDSLNDRLKEIPKSNKQEQKEQEKLITMRDVWVFFLTKLNDPSWTFYYMVKLADPSLINIHQNRDDIIIHLIKKENLTKQSYPIFKSAINDTKNMPVILDKIMDSYENQQNYVENYQFHNKLILINQRFPNTKIQQCILRWISVGENKLPLKIPQNYYIQFLKKKLKNLTENVGFDSILKVNKYPQQLPKLTKQIQKIFQVLLYFPFHKFKSFQLSKKNEEKQTMKQKSRQQQLDSQGQQMEEKGEIPKENQKSENQQQIADNQGDWQQEDEDNGQLQIKKTSSQKINNIAKPKQQSVNNVDNSSEQQSDSHELQQNDQDEDQDNNNYGDQRPDILQIFYEEEKAEGLKGYKRYCQLRERLDVYVKSNYEKLLHSPVSDNQFLLDTLLAIVKELNNMLDPVQASIVMHMPQNLLKELNKLGYVKNKDKAKLQQLRKPQKKIFQFEGELFSDRAQSDASQDENNEDGEYIEQYYGEDNIDQAWANEDSIEEDEDVDVDINDEDMDEDEDNNNEKMNANNNNNNEAASEVIIVKKGPKQPNQEQQDDIELPQLSSQFSKVQAEIKGSQLDRKQLTKILQIFLVQLFKLTPINFKKKQIVFSYVQIMQSDLGQIFFQSVLTILRMDQNPNKNRKLRLQEMKNILLKNNSPYQLEHLTGFQQFSKYNGLVNFIHLLKALKEKGKYLDDESNPFKKQSGTLLPIAEKFIIEFDLPIQTNVFSLVLLYVHSKSKVRDMIQNIAVSYDSDGVKLTKKQIKRISSAFFAQKTHHSAWQFIESTLNYKVDDIDRLIISLDTYSQQVFNSLASSALRVKQTIEKSNQSYSSAKILSEKEMKPSNLTHIKHYQRLYYITSNLLASCSQEIKQFYFMNKQICRYLWEDDDENSDNYNYSKVPNKLLKAKDQIYTNQSFVSLLQLAFRIIYFVKKQLYGKVSPQKFARIIHYPKMIIQTATLYMHLTGKKGKKIDWKFLGKKEVQNIAENTQMGGYKFKSLIQVYNLIIGLLEIESFSNGKFKELLIPYFTENKQLGLQAPLMFKVPEIDENNINGQNIFVTRECSFDMAFYQVNGQGLFVQFHGQEGSDHGGMIRELMMGWKGVGFGQQYFFIGKILGISFRQSVPYGGYIDLQMCIKITNYQLTMQNLQEIDKQIHSSLRYILQNDPENLGLTFSVMKKNPNNFDVQEYDLKQNGRNIAVVEDNKQQYVKLYLQKYYQIGRETQLSEIATGFYTVVPKSYAAIFKPHELMQHIKGQEVCDINVLKSHVRYMEGYTETSVIIKWLWEILQNYNQEQLNKFIQFLTGSPKLPIFNPNFQICIERVFDVKNLPVAHTCFNTLDLPEYPTKDILQKKLLTAIFEGNQNFGIM